MIEFPMCHHPESFWIANPVRTVGYCPVHNYVCPACGFGRGTLPICDCLEQEAEPGITLGLEVPIEPRLHADRAALMLARKKIEESGVRLKSEQELTRETSRDPDSV